MGATVGGIQYLDAVRWSTPADIGGVPDSWDHLDTTKVAGLTNLGGNGGRIIDGKSLRDAFIVYRESGISVFDYIGGNFVWRIRNVSTTVGLVAPDCIVEANGLHLFLGDGDVFSFDGNTTMSIMEDVIREEFIDDINPDEYLKSYVVQLSSLSEAWFCVPTKNSVYPDKAYVYNWLEKAWTTRSIPQDDTTNAEFPTNPVVFSTYGKQLTKSSSWAEQAEMWAEVKRRWTATSVSPLRDIVVGVTRAGDIVTNFELIEDTDPPFAFDIVSPSGLDFSPDGTKMLIMSLSGNEVVEYTCSTPFLPSSSTLVGRFNFGVETGTLLMDLCTNDAGTVLSTPWLVSSIVFDTFVGSPDTQILNPGGIHYSNNRNIIVAGQNRESIPKAVIEKWGLGGVDDGTLIFPDLKYIQTGNIAEASDIQGLTFSDEGTIVYGSYFVGGVYIAVLQAQLDLPYLLSDFSDLRLSGDFALAITSIAFDSINESLVTLSQFDSEPNDITQLSDRTTFTITPRTPSDAYIIADGTKIFTANRTAGFVTSYDFTIPWEIAGLVNEVNSGTPTGGNITSVGGMTFSTDGLSIYRAGTNGPKVTYIEQINLTTAFDFSGLGTTDNVDVVVDLQTELPNYPGRQTGGLRISNDGTKVLILDIFDQVTNTSFIYQYTLGTPWNLTTRVYDGRFDLSATGPGPRYAMELSENGLVLYVSAFSPNTLLQFNLSASHDVISVAPVFNGSGDLDAVVPAVVNSPELIYFKPDGDRVYTAGANFGGGYDQFTVGSGLPGIGAQVQDVIITSIEPLDAGSLVYLDGGIKGGENFVAFDTMIERVGYPLNGLNRVSTITRVYPHIRAVDDSDQPEAERLKVFIQLGSQDYPGSVIRWKPAVGVFPNHVKKVDIRTTGELHCWRIYSENTNKEWFFSGVDIEWVDTGER